MNNGFWGNFLFMNMGFLGFNKGVVAQLGFDLLPLFSGAGAGEG